MPTWTYFGTPVFGHTNPTLSVVAELVRRGERVVYYNSERFADAIRATGAEFRPYRNMPALPPTMSTRMVEMVPLLSDATEAFLAEHVDELLSDRPDFVIHDCVAIWGAEASRLMERPRIATVPTLLVNDTVDALANRIMPRDIRPGGSGIRVRDLPLLWSVFLQRLRTNRRHGLKYKKILELVHAEFNVVFTSAALQPHADEFADRFAFVGSPTVERTEEADFPFDELRDAPLVYISLGTLFNDRPDLFQLCFDALGDLDIQVLLSRGKADATQSKLVAPDNFRIESYVPQLSVLSRSAAFVTHGGIGSASEALHCGTPQVFLPQIWDGYLMAHQISQAGAGILLPPEPSAEQLRAAVKSVLEDRTYQEKARRLGEDLSSAGGAAGAADAIQGWADSQRGGAVLGSQQGSGRQALAKT